MRVSRIANQDSFEVKHGNGQVLVRSHGITYHLPTVCPITAMDWKKRSDGIVGSGWKYNGTTSRETFGVFYDRDFYKLGKQLSKM